MALIALLTDFGLQDHYVGTMKGVIQSIAPGTDLVDLTHDIPAGDIENGAYQLMASARYFPRETIFLVVVDPGVGTLRRGIVVQTSRFTYVGPDNGVLSWAFQQDGDVQAHELANPDYRLTVVSSTFHGRDVFAPAAAWLARGVSPDAFGEPCETARLELPEVERDGNVFRGMVLHIDHFGNVITNVPAERFGGWDPALLEGGRLSIGEIEVTKFCRTFGDLDPGEPGVLLGSSGYLEVVLNGGKAAEQLDVKTGQAVVLHLPQE